MAAHIVAVYRDSKKPYCHSIVVAMSYMYRERVRKLIDTALWRTLLTVTQNCCGGDWQQREAYRHINSVARNDKPLLTTIMWQQLLANVHGL